MPRFGLPSDSSGSSVSRTLASEGGPSSFVFTRRRGRGALGSMLGYPGAVLDLRAVTREVTQEAHKLTIAKAVKSLHGRIIVRSYR